VSSERTTPLLPRTVLDLIMTLRDSASLLRADHGTLRRAQMFHSDRMVRALTDVRCRVAVRTSSVYTHFSFYLLSPFYLQNAVRAVRVIC